MESLLIFFSLLVNLPTLSSQSSLSLHFFLHSPLPSFILLHSSSFIFHYHSSSSPLSPHLPFLLFSSLFYPIVSSSFIPSLSLCIFFTHAPYYPPPSTILPLPPPPWFILFPPSYLLSFSFLFPLYLVSPSLNSHFPPLSLLFFHSSISFSLIFFLIVFHHFYFHQSLPSSSTILYPFSSLHQPLILTSVLLTLSSFLLPPTLFSHLHPLLPFPFLASSLLVLSFFS